MSIQVDKISDTEVQITDSNVRVSTVTIKSLYQRKAMLTDQLADINEKIKQAEALGIKQ
jgi:hypothetical protein